MPKITIDLPLEVNKKLKEKAKADYRSLANYITVALINLANDDNTNVIDLSSLPEGTTIRTKTARVLTPEEERIKRYDRFQTLAKQILGHAVTEIEDYRIMDYNSDNLYYDEALTEPISEGSSIKCMYIYNLPEKKQIEYLEELKHYEQ